MSKPDVLIDTECYRDYWLFKARRLDTGAVIEVEQYPGRPLNRSTILRILRTCRLISFNGNDYDLPMIAYACSPYAPTCEELKAASDAIIQRNLRGWQFADRFQVQVPEVDHIDLIEVAPGVQISQKQYAGRMHSKRMQDLPFEPDASITPAMRAALRAYCSNDLDVLADLWRTLRAQIQLREAMTAEYGIDLRSKSDAQIAEAVLKSKLQQLLRCKIRRPELPDDYSFRYRVPDFIAFRTPQLRDTLDRIRAHRFVLTPAGSPAMPAFLSNLKIRIGAGVYRMGIGGLHSCEKSVAHIADDTHYIEDNDVASFYPAIILNLGLRPPHLGRSFLHVYRDLVAKRLDAKRSGDKTTADSLKITINGAYGKTGSPWSILYSPDVMLQVTITGQLSLLMLIEMLEDAGITVISANTDGVVSRVPRWLQGNMRAVVKAWERLTGFETEPTRYRALYSRDVNSYIAVKPDGATKGKGAYVWHSAEELARDPVAMLKTAPDCTIVVEAVTKFLASGTPIEETIVACRDVRQFVSMRRVTGGAVWRDESLGKVVRWYYATGDTAPILYRKDGRKVGSTDGCRPLMALPDTLPHDINFAHYIAQARAALIELGHTPRPPKVRQARAKKTEGVALTEAA